MKKVYLVFIFILTTISCKAGNEMKGIEALGSKVMSSSNVVEEKQFLERIWDYVYNNRVYVEIFSFDKNGVKSDINDIDDLSVVVKVQAVFSKNDQSYTLEWMPIELDNVFILFREK